MAKKPIHKFDANEVYDILFKLLSTRPKSFSHSLDIQNEFRATLQGIHNLAYEQGYTEGLDRQLEIKSNNLDN